MERTSLGLLHALLDVLHLFMVRPIKQLKLVGKTPIRVFKLPINVKIVDVLGKR